MAIEVLPAELAAAAAPLRAAGRALRALGDGRREVLGLVEDVPSADLREAVEQYVVAWSHVALDLGDQATELGEAVGYAADWYADRERALARGFRVTGRMP